MKRVVKRFIIPDDVSEQRIDQALPQLDKGLSRTFVRKVIDFGGAHVNGRRTRSCSQKIVHGDEIELFIDGLPYRPFALLDRHIVYQDEYILVVNKPAGIDSQPTPSRYKGTMYSALLDYLVDPYKRHLKPSIGMVQRLDRDTSGLMVFSVHQHAHKKMTAQFSSRAIEKKYLAIVQGRMHPEQGEMKSLLARNRATNLMKSVAKGGQEAITRFRTLHVAEQASLVEIELVTGRSHQIRVHFSESGHPLLGDVRYGGLSEFQGHEISRQLLHASALSFTHPVQNRQLIFEQELPEDMAFFARLIESESSQ